MLAKDLRFSQPQLNEVHALALKLGLDPADFKWTVAKGDWDCQVHNVEHIPTGGFLKTRVVQMTTGIFCLERRKLADRESAYLPSQYHSMAGVPRPNSELANRASEAP